MMHYDSNKTYRGRIWAYNLSWRSLSRDGILVSDDIGNNVAFKHFVETKEAEYYVCTKPNSCHSRGKSGDYVAIAVKK